MTRSNSRFVVIAVALCACILSIVLVSCGSKAADNTNEPTDATSTQADGQDASDSDAPKASKGATGKKARNLDVTTVQAKKARSFITVFVATHVRNTGEEGAPMEMTQEDWVSNCTSYVDPESELAKTLGENPESLRSPYGTHDQRVVNATKASRSGEDDSVLITATVESTMQDWDDASTHKETYLVRFSDSNLITAVEPRGMQPAT